MAATEDPPAPHGATEDSDDSDDDDDDEDDEVGGLIANGFSKCEDIGVSHRWLCSNNVSKYLEDLEVVFTEHSEVAVILVSASTCECSQADVTDPVRLQFAVRVTRRGESPIPRLGILSMPNALVVVMESILVFSVIDLASSGSGGGSHQLQAHKGGQAAR